MPKNKRQKLKAYQAKKKEAALPSWIGRLKPKNPSHVALFNALCAESDKRQKLVDAERLKQEQKQAELDEKRAKFDPVKFNIWTCPNEHHMICGDLDEGTTPFAITCARCGREARSHFYNEKLQGFARGAFTFVWSKEYHGTHPAILEHVAKGGLVMYDLDGNLGRDWKESE